MWGIGKFTYRNGDVFEGEFVQGQANGKGKMTYANGNEYDGYWVENQFNG